MYTITEVILLGKIINFDSLLSYCRILQFPRPVKLDDLKAKARVAFGQTMDLHYTNNEVDGVLWSSGSQTGGPDNSKDNLRTTFTLNGPF